jgi:hypothetical protein
MCSRVGVANLASGNLPHRRVVRASRSWGIGPGAPSRSVYDSLTGHYARLLNSSLTVNERRCGEPLAFAVRSGHGPEVAINESWNPSDIEKAEWRPVRRPSHTRGCPDSPTIGQSQGDETLARAENQIGTEEPLSNST